MKNCAARLCERSATSASIVLLGLLGTASCHADSLGDLFKDGVFGLPWGSSNVAFESKMPNGQWRGSDTYVVRDSKTVLGTERKQRDMVFGFSQGELTNVTIQFQGGPSMYKRIKERALLAFGAYAHREDIARVGKDGVGRTAVRWLPDNGVSIYLLCELEGMQPDCNLTISYVWPLRPTTLKAIGLE